MYHGQYDTTRLDQNEHDIKLFDETVNILQGMHSLDLTTKLYGLQHPALKQSGTPEVLCDYFKGAKFSRG